MISFKVECCKICGKVWIFQLPKLNMTHGIIYTIEEFILLPDEIRHKSIILSYSGENKTRDEEKGNLTEIENYLSNFGTVFLDMKYPSHSFDDIYTQLLILKNKISTQSRIIISIFVNETSKTDMKFRNNKNIKIIRPDETVTEFKEGECSSLIQIMLPTSIEEISENSFEGCSSLEKVTISSTVKLIKNSCFSGCSSLKEITIPTSIEEIGDNSFENCKLLNKYHFV